MASADPSVHGQPLAASERQTFRSEFVSGLQRQQPGQTVKLAITHAPTTDQLNNRVL